MTICNLCGKEIKKFGMGGHMRMAHTEVGKESIKKANNARKGKSYSPWNKGLSKETDERVKQQAKSISGRIVKESTCKKLSEIAKRQKLGGYNPKGGRGKKGWYKGYWCDSSWELAWVIFNLDNGIKFTKNFQKFSYTFKGKQKNYIPDFLLENGTYIEVKGYFTEEVNEKIKQFPNQLKVFGKVEMKSIIEYVELKYGKDFIQLYEEDRNAGR